MCTEELNMESITHPVSGENGYFCSEREKTLIDAVLVDFVVNQSILQVSSADGRGVGSE